jgi:hypothetical protein
MELIGVLIVLVVGFFLYVAYRVWQVHKEVHAVQLVDSLPISTLAACDLAHTGTNYQLVSHGWNWQDIWVGIFWKYADYYEGVDEGDFDRLRLYICPVPCYLITLDRVRHYKIIPRADSRIDPVCKHCAERHSAHPVVITETEHCTGKF